MPTYDFTCEKCGETFEMRLSMAAYDSGEGRVCPSCGSSDVQRAFTAVNVIGGVARSIDSRPHAPPSCGPGGFT
jgi:putative FmdB family regulatory protein